MGKIRNHKPKPPRKNKPASDMRGDVRGEIPSVCVLVITQVSDDGELIAEPAKWDIKRKPPHIVVTESSRGAALVKGDRILAKMRKVQPHVYQALAIRTLPSEAPQVVLGVFVPTADGGLIEPISRKMKESFMVAAADTGGAQQGELVSGITQPGVPSLGMTYARITDRLGTLDSPKAASLIAANMHQLPSVFSEAALVEATSAESPVMEAGRVDLRDIPLVTIDGEDARDFDDAVFAEPDDHSNNPANNPGGWHCIVAIADVAHYVSEGSALDSDAFERGNSTYFPDRVIPMLPERLSNGLCSLTPNEDRYCLAVHLWIDRHGHVLKYEFVRGLMRSHARLTYEQVETMDSPEVRNLKGAYEALATERDQRGALDLNLPEFKIVFDAAGQVAAITPKTRLESHRLIEAFMIAANVAAADFLLKHKATGIYRVHEPPSEDKLEELTNLLKISGYSLHTGAGIKAGHFNRILQKVDGKPEAYLVNTAILRSQMQAYYAPENLGHFGLSLQKYCHFTSPIRRYADLVVHRSLASLVDGGRETVDKKKTAHRSPSTANALADIAQHISDTERRAMLAERDASDRYKVAFMSRHVGADFAGIIVSLNEYGLFVSLNANGITGFIPVRNLGGDFYHYDKHHAAFKGRRTGTTFRIGDPLMIRVQSTNAITGSLIFEIASSAAPQAPLRGPRSDMSKKEKPRRDRPKKDKANKKDRHRDRKNKGKRRKPTAAQES